MLVGEAVFETESQKNPGDEVPEGLSPAAD